MTDAGVVQVVAVTNPLSLGLRRMAMIGVHTAGPTDDMAKSLQAMDDIGFHRSPISKAMFPNLDADVPALDFSGWPVYTHAGAPDDLIYAFCQGLEARKSDIIWQEPRDLPLDEMCRDTQAGPLKVPLHPAAERFWHEMGYL